jgi:acyl-CoA thioester hydrolase
MSEPNPFRFCHRLRVRWGECDMQGIVFNPHYMAYVDAALTEYWRAVGLPYPQAFAQLGTDTFMVAANQTYADAARFDDELDVWLRTEYLGNTSLRLAFAIHREADRLFHGTATYVNGDRITRKPVRLGDLLRKRIGDYEAPGS